MFAKAVTQQRTFSSAVEKNPATKHRTQSISDVLSQATDRADFSRYTSSKQYRDSPGKEKGRAVFHTPSD